MADTMDFSLVSPERSLAAFAATAVQIPGSDGDMTAMPNHAPTITTLRPGVLTAEGESGTEQFLVTGGFAEVADTGVSVLAERAFAKADVTQDDLDSMLSETKSAIDAASEGALDAAQKAHADVVAMAAELGLSVA